MAQPQMEDQESNQLTVMPGGVPANQDKGMVDVQSAAAIARIQGAMVMAKRFPRDENAALTRIKQAAQRRRLAESAEYEYTRGGSKISGPSIRAAEAVAQAWGNIDMGVVELKRDTGKESIAMAYAIDLETNTTKSITFAVPHVRESNKGNKTLTESRDVYETVMNQGSRRLRNCILAVIPGDVMDEFIEEANRTMTKDSVPLAQRIKLMVEALATVDVTKAMIEQTYGCKVEALTERQVASIRNKYNSLKDGFGAVADYFKTPSSGESAGKAGELNQRMKAQAAPAVPSQAGTAPEPTKPLGVDPNADFEPGAQG